MIYSKTNTLFELLELYIALILLSNLIFKTGFDYYPKPFYAHFSLYNVIAIYICLFFPPLLLLVKIDEEDLNNSAEEPSYFFILNLSVCGLFFSINSLLMLFTKWFLFPSLLAVSQSLLGVVITAYPLFQCLICVERYLAVVHPVIFLKYKPLRYRVICCTAAWIITLGSCLISMLTFITFNIYMYMWYISVQFLIFLLYYLTLLSCFAVWLFSELWSSQGQKTKCVRERGGK